MTLAQSILDGNRRALARLLTWIENEDPRGFAELDALFPHTGKAFLIGVTGAPGTGKSSLVNRIALHYRREYGRKVAIVAVDPSSPFTGGAVLGDRVRMRDLHGDPGVFIRSMASRGSLGGLAQATARVVQAFDAAGYEVILIETVGAGQAEVDIAKLAHTTLVVEAPGLGDDVQAIKAGILEIADILVVNKADRPGVENTERALRGMLELAHPVRRVFRHHGKSMVVDAPMTNDIETWIPPIQRTVATEGTGIAELVTAIEKHADHLRQNGDWDKRNRVRLQAELEDLLRETLMARLRRRVPPEAFNRVLDDLVARRISPRAAANRLLENETVSA